MNTAAKRMRMRQLRHFRFARVVWSFACCETAAADERVKDHKYRKEFHDYNSSKIAFFVEPF